MTVNKRKMQLFYNDCFFISLYMESMTMLFDIFVLTSVKYSRKFTFSQVTFFLSVTILFIVKKRSGSLKSLFLRLGEIKNIFFLLNLAMICLF